MLETALSLFESSVMASALVSRESLASSILSAMSADGKGTEFGVELNESQYKVL
jgi:hypothetical protein